MLVIPNAALKWIGDRQVVFAVAGDGSVREVSPTLGLEGLNETEVTAGLSPGEKVATQIVLPGLAAPPISAPRANKPVRR